MARKRPPLHHVPIELGNAKKLVLRACAAVHRYRAACNDAVLKHPPVPGKVAKVPKPPSDLPYRVAQYVAYLPVVRKGIEFAHSYFPFLYPLPAKSWTPFGNGISFAVRNLKNVTERHIGLVEHWPVPPSRAHPATISVQGGKWVLSYRGEKPCHKARREKSLEAAGEEAPESGEMTAGISEPSPTL